MDWRREDTGYAAATVGAVAFVAYLLAANFGLVPTPLARLLDGSPPDTVLIAAAADVGATTGLPQPPPAATVGRPSATLPPATTGVRDAVKPAISVTTPDGTTFGLTEPAVVEGTAADERSGIDEVEVVYATSSGRRVVPADVSCASSRRRSCTWTAEVPGILGDYAVSARARDTAGNSARSDPIGVSVVNTGGAVEQTRETLGRAPGALTGAVEALLEGLGGAVRG